MDFLYNMLENIYDELEKLSRMEMTQECLDHIEKLTHSAKSIETILAMKDTGDYRSSYDGNYRDSYDSYDTYDSTNSTRRGRNGRGRYTSRMYRDSEKDNLVAELRRRMSKVSNEKEKEAYRQVINMMEKE